MGQPCSGDGLEQHVPQPDLTEVGPDGEPVRDEVYVEVPRSVLERAINTLRLQGEKYTEILHLAARLTTPEGQEEAQRAKELLVEAGWSPRQ